MSAKQRKQFKAGLVGAGHIAEFHLQALKRIPGVEVVGICDLDRAKAEALAGKFNVPVVESLAALRAAGADVIHVVTPPHTHAAVATEALKAGCHVFVEKPLATDADECVRLRDLARAQGKEVCVCHSLLWDPQVRVGAGVGARPASSATWSRSTSCAARCTRPWPARACRPSTGRRGIHFAISASTPSTSSRPSWARSRRWTRPGSRAAAIRTWRSTTGAALVSCKKGMGQVQLSWGVRPLQHQIVIQGTKGVLRLDLFLMFQAWRKSMPLPKPAERIVNALTDSIQPLIDVPSTSWRSRASRSASTTACRS